MNGPNKLECCITQDRENFQDKKQGTLAEDEGSVQLTSSLK